MSESVSLAERVKRLAVERLDLVAADLLDDYPSLKNNIEVEAAFNLRLRGLVLQFRTWAVKGVEGRPGFLHVPANWWEAFKAEVLPDWVTARWPVRYKPLSYTSYFVCPHSTVAWPDERHLDFLRDGPA